MSQDQQQAFARHDGMTRGGMPEVVQAQLAESGVFADGPPAGFKAVRPPAFGMAGKQ